MTESIPLMKCRECGGMLTPVEETLACVDCGKRFENLDDAIGGPWDEPDEPRPFDCECCGYTHTVNVSCESIVNR